MVSAYEFRTIMNPFTGKLDYYTGSNFTGHNITGDYLFGDGSNLINVQSGNFTQTEADPLYVNIDGDTMTGNLDMDGNSITNLGELVMIGVITSQNILPTSTNLYTIGNSTNWFAEIYVQRIHSTNITAEYLNSSSVDSDTVEIQNNLTIAGYEIKEEEGWLTFRLTS
jgi:hypothetical protein